MHAQLFGFCYFIIGEDQGQRRNYSLSERFNSDPPPLSSCGHFKTTSFSQLAGDNYYYWSTLKFRFVSYLFTCSIWMKMINY